MRAVRGRGCIGHLPSTAPITAPGLATWDALAVATASVYRRVDAPLARSPPTCPDPPAPPGPDPGTRLATAAGAIGALRGARSRGLKATVRLTGTIEAGFSGITRRNPAARGDGFNIRVATAGTASVVRGEQAPRGP